MGWKVCINLYLVLLSEVKVTQLCSTLCDPLDYISSVQSLSCVRLFATPWIAARQASLSITNSWSSLKLKSIESVMPSSLLILCGILQARILEWVAIPFCRASSQLRDWTQVSHIASEFFTSWATREAQKTQRGLINMWWKNEWMSEWRNSHCDSVRDWK